jgi:acyl-coenzyme A synthetase/AMP-(fatty) acid ligase
VPADQRHPPSLDDLRAFARERLAAARAPRELVLVDGLPRTPSGKLLRRLLPGTAGAKMPPERLLEVQERYDTFFLDSPAWRDARNG